MTPFELVEPATLKEALALLDPDDPDVRPIAGGTALMLMMKSGLYRPQRLVSLRALGPALTDIAATSDGGLAIGAMVRLAGIERSDAVRHVAPVIADTLLTHSNVRVRNVATLGGNLAHADPHMDLPPVLIALGASVRAVGPSGERDIPVEALLTGYMATVLGNDELITALHIPPQTGRKAAYAKVTARSADDWPALGIAVSLGPAEVRIAVGAATETAMRLPQTEALLAGQRPDDRLLREAGKCAAAEAPVVGDLHGSAAYKRVLVEVHLRRALQKALAA
ncbi:MAG TPA: xanthine dehydrogenase family protein subunit M [Stellaceae bacterium]|nr:xanthine dehydrogenase family protein subunit M [Stellaceae bacterium]